MRVVISVYVVHVLSYCVYFLVCTVLLCLLFLLFLFVQFLFICLLLYILFYCFIPILCKFGVPVLYTLICIMYHVRAATG